MSHFSCITTLVTQEREYTAVIERVAVADLTPFGRQDDLHFTFDLV